MCFSAPADLVGGLIVGAIGVDVVRHVGHRRQLIALAALPLLLAAHQIVEAFVWWGLDGTVSAGLGRAAMWVYLVFAFVVLPVYVPLAVLALETTRWRRSVMAGFVALGVAVSVILGLALVRGPVTAELAHYHLRYSSGLSAGTLIVTGYVVATCGSLIVSGFRQIAWFGAINIVAVAVVAELAIDGFASLWCAWAAISSAAIALHIRSGGRRVGDRTVVVAAL